MRLVLVLAGGAVGSAARYLIQLWMTDRFGGSFPWGTLTVNVTGSLILGLVLGLPLSPGLVALLGTGFCGTLTTFSTFGADVLRLLEQRQLARGLAHLAATVVLGVGAAALGYVLASG